MIGRNVATLSETLFKVSRRRQSRLSSSASWGRRSSLTTGRSREPEPWAASYAPAPDPVERVTIDCGVTPESSRPWSTRSRPSSRGRGGAPPPFPVLPHVRVGRITVDDQIESDGADMATFKRLYLEAVSVAETIWDSADTEASPTRPRGGR